MKKHSYPGFEIPACHRHRPLERRRVALDDGAWAFIGYGTSIFGAVAAKDGYFLVDAGDSLAGSGAAKQEISRLAPGSLRAVILTHSHPDHRAGGGAFLEGEGEVPVYGHHAFGSEQRDGKGLGGILGLRARRQFGFSIPDGEYTANSLVPRVEGKPGKLLCPGISVGEGMTKLEIGGVALELHAIPSETADHLAVWLPQRKILFCGDAAYGSFPNLYPLRGGAYRDVERWAAAVRRMAGFGAEALVCGHVTVLFGKDIAPFLNSYAEALEFVYGETLRLMDAGMGPDEIAACLRLPEHLRDLPFLGEFYGSVPWSVREIFAAKIGWFDGNPANIVPLAPREEAERVAKLAGGQDRLVEAAGQALRDGDFRWAARLADFAMILGEGGASLIKADALDALSREILPISGINYLRSCALELRGGGQDKA